MCIVTQVIIYHSYVVLDVWGKVKKRVYPEDASVTGCPAISLDE